MRYRAQYTIFPRTFPSGNVYYYYRPYDEDGNLTTPKSTGQKTKTAARRFCEELIKIGGLHTYRDISFNEFAKNWWIYDKCDYVQSKLKRGYTFSRMYVDIQRMNLDKHILPYFGKKKLNRITSKDIETWLFSFVDKGLSNSTANHNFATLRIMFNEAFRLDYIKRNPIKSVRPLKENVKRKGLLSDSEFKSLFDGNRINEIWGKELYFTANLLSAMTGMRLGEIQGLQSEDVKKNYINVCHSLDRKYGLKGTKTKVNRKVPVTDRLLILLESFKDQNKQGYLFSNDNGLSPLYHKTITKALYKALETIGIDKEIRKKRNITFHSWRHFFITKLREAKIHDNIIRLVSGHRTKEMTERYTNTDSLTFDSVRKVQEKNFLIA